MQPIKASYLSPPLSQTPLLLVLQAEKSLAKSPGNKFTAVDSLGREEEAHDSYMEKRD